MTTLYWSCLGGGFALTVLMLVVGEVLEAALDALDGALEGLGVDAFDPLSLLAGVTLFGGAGLILDSAFALGVGLEVAVAALVGVVGAVLLHVVYVKPMKRSENSTAFSVQEYAGKAGELATGRAPRGLRRGHRPHGGPRRRSGPPRRSRATRSPPAPPSSSSRSATASCTWPRSTPTTSPSPDTVSSRPRVRA